MTIETLPIFPFPANWSDDVVESYEWLTEVLQSESGAEQRRTLRLYPRRYLEFSIATVGPYRSYLDLLLFKNGSGDWWVPFWPHQNRLSSTIPVGTTVLPLRKSVDGYNVAAGDPIIIAAKSLFDFEVLEVASVGTNSITLTSATIKAHEISSGVYPARKCKLVDQPTLSRLTADIGRTSVKHQVLGRNYWPISTTISDSGPMIVDGLISNSYHNETGRGGYFHSNSGTSEGQSIMIHALLRAYNILRDGTTDEVLVADWYKALSLLMLDALGDGTSTGPMLRQEIPTDPTTITMLHWLFAARGDIPVRGIVYDLDLPTQPGNTLIIPANARGSRVYTVWKIYPATSALLYDSPYSAAYHVKDDGTMEGDDTSITIADDSTGWQSLGLAAKVLIPNSAPYQDYWKVIYGYNSDSLIPIKSAQEAYPSWTLIDAGYVACAPDTFRWFDQAIGMAIDLDTRTGKSTDWTNLRNAMRRSCVRGQSISDLRMIIEPYPGFDAIPIKGAPDGMFCFSTHPSALSPIGGGNINWKGYDFWSRNSEGVLVGSVPSDNLTSGDAYQLQIGRGFTDSWRVATTYQDPDYYIYVAMATSKVPVAANGEAVFVYVSTEMSYSADTRWYADIGVWGNYVAKTDGTTIDFFIPRSAFKRRYYDTAGEVTWDYTPFPEGSTFQNFGITVEMHEAYTVWLKYLRLVSGPSQAWIDANPAEAVNGTKMPFFPGALPFATNANIPKQRYVGWNGSPFHGYQFADFWWYLEDHAETVHSSLTVADLPIPNRTTGAMEFPISATNVNGTTKPKHALLMEQQLMFLKHAQLKYKDDAGSSVPIGPFAHTFVLNTPARSSLAIDGVVPTPHTWTYTNDDPNTKWIGYQTRIVENLGSLCLLVKDDTRFQTCYNLAHEMLVNWLNFLNSWWPNLNGVSYGGSTVYGSPTNYPDPRISVPYADYEEPHGPALIFRGCLFLKQADSSLTTLCDALMTRCWNYIEMLWRTTGEMAYTWSPDPSKKQWYGFWHGEIMLMLCDMLENPTLVPSGINLTTVRERLVLTQTWLETWGVRSGGAVTLSSLDYAYKGYSVFTMNTNETGSLDVKYSRLITTVDNQTGIPVDLDHGERNYSTQKMSFVLKGAAQHNKILGIFHEMRGSATPVWLPTFMQDLFLTQAIGLNTASMIIKRCGFTDTGGPQDGRKYIMIRLKSGEYYFREVTTSALYGTTEEILALDVIIRKVINPQDVDIISFMELCRLGSDTVEVSHRSDQTDGVSVIDVTFVSAPEKREPLAAFYE